MGIALNTGADFEPCPEYTGPAVLVDITEPKETVGQYGTKLTFKLVFEINAQQDDGTPFAVWSPPFTMMYTGRSNLKKFLDKWLKRELNDAEKANLDLLIGTPANITVVHEEHEGKTYSNIGLCLPATTPFRPSGKFVRQKDRKPTNGTVTTSQQSQPAQQTGQDAGAKNDYHSFGNTPEKPSWQAYKIELEGNLKGMALGDLPKDKMDALVNKWLLPLGDKIKAGYNCKAWENRMVNALNLYIAATESMEPNQPVEDQDQVPMDF